MSEPSKHAALEPLHCRPLGRGFRHAFLHQFVGVLPDRPGAQLLRCRRQDGARGFDVLLCASARSSSESTTEAATR